MAKEGETVEPGVKIAIISKSGEGIEQVAPSDAQPEPPKEKESAEKQVPKAEPAPVKGTTAQPKARAPSPPPSPKRVASEPQLPPKDRERRVSLDFLVYLRKRSFFFLILNYWMRKEFK